MQEKHDGEEEKEEEERFGEKEKETANISGLTRLPKIYSHAL